MLSDLWAHLHHDLVLLPIVHSSFLSEQTKLVGAVDDTKVRALLGGADKTAVGTTDGVGEGAGLGHVSHDKGQSLYRLFRSHL